MQTTTVPNPEPDYQISLSFKQNLVPILGDELQLIAIYQYLGVSASQYQVQFKVINSNNRNQIQNATRKVFNFNQSLNSFVGFSSGSKMYLAYTLNLEKVLNDTDLLAN